MRTPALVLACALAGCGARTALSTGDPQPDAGSTLDGGIDAGRDAGTDAGPDAGPEIACASDADCRLGACRARPALVPSDLEPLPLVCGALDPGGPVGSSCSARGECDRGICTVSGACVMPCAIDAHCAANERCRTVWVQTGAASMQPVDACALLVAAPESVRVVGPEPGPTLTGFFATAEDALATLEPNALVVWTAPSSTLPFIQEIRTRGASPALVFDAFVGGPEAPAPSWGVSPTTVSDVVTLLYPNGPGTPSSPDGFTVTMASDASASTERFVLQREGEGTSFDVDAYLVGGGRWTTREGSVPRQLTAAISDARGILAAVGLTIGEVRVHEVVGALRRRYELIEGESGPFGVPEDLAPMYMLSAGARRPSVHVFFVRTIEGALGIASGIPGPHAFAGTGASGVAIAVDVIPPGQLGLVIVHELGHFMGLFHTSELDGSVYDPFPDTGECRSDRDRDGDGALYSFECAGVGAENIMFWSGEDTGLSPMQGELMRRAYFVP